VKTKTLTIALTLLLTIAAFAGICLAQRSRTAAPPRVDSSLLASLPPSDAVGLVQVRRLLQEALPQILADSPKKLAEVNAELDKFKTRTGIDARQFDQIAFGMHYNYPAPGVTKVDSVVLARGTFNTAALAAAGRLAAAGKYREETYQGHTVYVFTFAEQMKLFGLLNLKINELAVSALNPNTLALGTPAVVRKAIDAGKRAGTSNQALIALATQDPNALAGFGGNVTAELIKSLDLSNEAIVKDMSTIRQVYGSVSLVAKDVQIALTARTVDAASAKNLSGTLEDVKGLAALFVGRLPPLKAKLAQSALNNLKITAQGNELRIRTSIAQADIGPVLRGQ
jgi:hypothetical protein